MTGLFTNTALRQLRDVSLGKPLVAFDFDGTLAPIVPDPRTATLRLTTRTLLKAVAKHYPTVVISGRRRADVKGRLSGIPLRAVVGNHGMEPRPRMNRPLAKKWHTLLAPKLNAIPGVDIENKGLTLAVHYRHAEDRKHARSTILRVTTCIPDVHIIEGKCVVNLVPQHAPDKAQALLALCRRHRCHSAIFVGDDDNDESVFELSRLGIRLLGVHIGRSQHSHAQYYLQNQRAVDRLLKQILSFTVE